MITLRIGTPYLSIKDLPEVSIPSFTLITGHNGAGKSHLLRAIHNGNVLTSVSESPKTEVRYFDWNNMVPTDPGAFDGHNLHLERFNLSQHHQSHVRSEEQLVITAAKNAGISPANFRDSQEIAEAAEDTLYRYLGNREQATQAYSSINAAATKASRRIRNRIEAGHREHLDLVSKNTGKQIFCLRPNDFTLSIPNWGSADLFQQSFGRLFVTYRDLWLSNRHKRLESIERGTQTNFLSEEEFVKSYGIAPWDFVNSAFEASGLDFKIDTPDLYSSAPYHPILTKVSTGARVGFGDLSSGEKIIMSFALCLYYAQDTRQISSYPKMLLLDEIDAPLHPSMARSLLKIINETIVERHGIAVIATTHSASTVALAAEEAIYVMKSGEPGLHKTSKSRALNLLTVGVPTLAISHEGRRQIFVESSVDAKLYATIYQHLKPVLLSERSLEFIATGAQTAIGELNAGCAVVKRIVNDLVKAGNSTVFGLLDWDGTNRSGERIFVVAEGSRNGLENLLLDPVLVAAALLRADGSVCELVGVEKGISYAKFLDFDSAKFQRVVDQVQKRILGDEKYNTESVSYLNGMSLNIAEQYLRMDDHKLASAIFHSLPEFNKIARNSSELLQYIASNVLADKPSLMPIEFRDAFLKVASAEI